MFRLKISPNCTEMSDHAFTNNTLFLKIIQCKRVKHFYYICFFEKNRCVTEAVAKSWRTKTGQGVLKPETERTWVRGALTFPQAVGGFPTSTRVYVPRTRPPTRVAPFSPETRGQDILLSHQKLFKTSFPCTCLCFALWQKRKKAFESSPRLCHLQSPGGPRTFLHLCKASTIALSLFSCRLPNTSDSNLGW